jgi:hypothetical protein
MKAIIEIPDDLIREACRATALSKPHLSDLACLAMDRLAKERVFIISLDDTSEKDAVEANIAMLCVTQTMDEIVKNYERN